MESYNELLILAVAQSRQKAASAPPENIHSKFFKDVMRDSDERAGALNNLKKKARNAGSGLRCVSDKIVSMPLGDEYTFHREPVTVHTESAYRPHTTVRFVD